MLWILLLLSHLVSVGRSGGSERALCVSDACYSLHTVTRVTFDRARAGCVDNGGSLMTVTDRREEGVLRALLPLAAAAAGSSRPGREKKEYVPVWIGLRLRRGQCVLPETSLRGFQWLSTTSPSTEDDPPRYSNWAAGHPISTCTEERCAQIRYFTSSGQQNQNQLKWLDGHCRRTAFYACKFHFKGMCRPLALTGPGRVNYTAPFSPRPLRSDMKSLPMGTYAEVSCGGDHRDDDPVHFSVCRVAEDGSYGWSSAGPFCASSSGKKNCAFNNGGCEHLCLEGEASSDGGVCECKEGYELSPADRASCSPTDPCGRAACQHRCVPGASGEDSGSSGEDSGFTCTCPAGFTLHANLRNCSDVDECHTTAGVCAGHACVNTEGGYVCDCRQGYEMVDGRCRDVDECSADAEAGESKRCDQKCLNSLGSFSCHCDAGFLAFGDDGRSCADIDECLSSEPRRCEFTCTNTVGGFTCAPCPEEDSHVDDGGISCVVSSSRRHDQRTEEEEAEQRGAVTSPSDHEQQRVQERRTTTTEAGPATVAPTAVPTTVEHQDNRDHNRDNRDENRTFPTAVEHRDNRDHNRTFPTDVLTAAEGTSVAPNNNNNNNNVSFGRNVLVVGRTSFNSRTLICVVGSVVPLLLVVMVTVAIVVFRGRRSSQRGAAAALAAAGRKKTLTADGYCWVSSGFEPHLEKLYESVLTDDDPPASTLESEA